jgi:hypothetical protein
MTRLAPLFTKPAFWPVFTWLLLQMLALALAAFRVPFSARYPAPEEQLAIEVLLVVQLSAAAMLSPLLFRNFATSVVVIISAVPFLQCATILAAETATARVVGVGVFVGVWVMALGLANAALVTPRAKMTGVAVVTFLTLGGAMLAYLRREFGAPLVTFDMAAHGWMGPIIAALALLESGPLVNSAWWFAGAALLFSVVLLAIRYLRHRQLPITTNGAQ